MCKWLRSFTEKEQAGEEYVKSSQREAGGRGVKGEAGPSGQVEVS